MGKLSKIYPDQQKSIWHCGGGLHGASWLYAAGSLLLLVTLSFLSAQCDDDAPKGAASDPKTSTKPKCDGKKLVVCAPDGHEVAMDCEKDGMSCLKNGKGEPMCGKLCPPYVDSFGACDNKSVQACDGEILVSNDCTKQNVNYTCGYLVEGYAQCTKMYCMESQEEGTYHSAGAPNAEGVCASDIMGSDPGDVGKVITGRCSGTVYQETLDCALAGDKYSCVRDAKGVVQCTEPNPGVDAFGRCGTDDDGDPVAEHLDGMQYFKIKCGEGTTCAEVDRFGVGCRGCGDALPEGKCTHSKTSRVTYCKENGERHHESCRARGGECGFNDKTCRYECLDTKDGRSCADEGLKPGEAKCQTDSFGMLPAIVLCTADGKREVVECPAAADGSVQCKEIVAGDMVLTQDGGLAEPMGELLLADGTPAGTTPTLGCVTTKPCGLMGRRCTDRGVLLECDAQLIPSWIDCREAGSTCVDDGTDAYCACGGALPAYASRCIHGQQLTCAGDRIARVGCSCAPP